LRFQRIIAAYGYERTDIMVFEGVQDISKLNVLRRVFYILDGLDVLSGIARES
jgi:hypothetical protein